MSRLSVVNRFRPFRYFYGRIRKPKSSLVCSQNTRSETTFVTQIEINDNAFGSIWLSVQMVDLEPDSFRGPACHVGGREFKSRTSRHLNLEGQGKSSWPFSLKGAP